jgi:hypothetical protein
MRRWMRRAAREGLAVIDTVHELKTRLAQEDRGAAALAAPAGSAEA